VYSCNRIVFLLRLNYDRPIDRGRSRSLFAKGGTVVRANYSNRSARARYEYLDRFYFDRIVAAILPGTFCRYSPFIVYFINKPRTDYKRLTTEPSPDRIGFINLRYQDSDSRTDYHIYRIRAPLVYLEEKIIGRTDFTKKFLSGRIQFGSRTMTNEF